MANRDFPVRHADPRGRRLWDVLRTEEMPWIHTPRWGWECVLTWQDVNGEHATTNATVTFTGTEADGDYVSTFYDSAGNMIATVTTTRAAGSPATFEDIVEQHVIDTAAESGLEDYVLAQQNGQAVELAGIEGQHYRVVTTAPAGVTVAEVHSSVIDLGSVAFDQGFPSNVIRAWCLVNVTQTFGAGRTLTVGDNNQRAGILGSTPITLNATGRSCSSVSDNEYQPRPELAFTPLATVALGDNPFLTQGSVLIEILFTPNLANVAAA